MKAQLDIIIAAVALVIALVVGFVFWATKRTPTTHPAPEAVNVAKVAYPPKDLVYGNSLPTTNGGAAAGNAVGGATGGGNKGLSKLARALGG